MFKPDFKWGVATAAYQIEGAAYEDGRGMSVWDVFSRTPGKTFMGHSGETACDHYHRYKEDVALMKEIGVKAYRFSVSWSRIFPEGLGEVNQKGADFYDSLIDELLKNGIVPCMTLFHWDYPYELYKKGGWLNPDSPKWFARYAEFIARRYGDRVKFFMTLNEPQCFIGCGHEGGNHAPGLRLPEKEVALAAHNALLAHGLGNAALRRNIGGKIQVSLAPCGSVVIPETEADIDEARQKTFERDDVWSNKWWYDTVFLGEYSPRLRALLGEKAADDIKIIAAPTDFVGTNFYQADTYGKGGFVRKKAGYPRTAMISNGEPWQISPECLYWGARFYYERYKKPIYITENGMSNLDVISLDGACHDPQRIDYLHRHLLALRRAAEDGADVGGYFQWSLMDNFEWADGYTQRFGLVFVDYETGKRTLKDSAAFYRETIESNGKNL